MKPATTSAKPSTRKKTGRLNNALAEKDPCQQSDRDLLACLLALDMPSEQARRMSSKCLARHDGLRGAISALRTGAFQAEGVGGNWLYILEVFTEVFSRQLHQGMKRGTALTSPSETLDYLQHILANRRREVFQCLFLDTRHRVICSKELFQGSIDGACVYPRVVAEHALRHNAAAVIVAHNHPSGVAEPSLADQAITRRLKDALALLEIRLLDHFVIGDGATVSMAARGML